MTYKKKIGTAGEELAAELLKSKGYYIIRRNFSCPYGEVDIIAVKDKAISFIEVKTGSPAEAVDMKKQKHIRNAARYFLSRYNREWDSLNFQVIEISIGHITGLEL